MREDDKKRFDRSQEAWSALADQFTQIAHQFRAHYQRVTAGTDPAGAASAETDSAGHRAGKAVEDAARAFESAIHDPEVRQDSAEAGSALLRAVGATLSELGAAIQREADDKQTPRP